MNICVARKVGGDYFSLIKLRKSNKTLDDFLGLFDPDDYWIYKATNNQRLVNFDMFLEFKYTRYIFFKKSSHNKEHIDIWINWFISLGGVQFIHKPTPPFDPQKIIIKK